MRNLSRYNRSALPRKAHVGMAVPPLDPRDQVVGASPSRHFTDVATNQVTPRHVFVDLDPHGEKREVIDGRD